jgi:predicted HicB family RNase H-like nuclease
MKNNYDEIKIRVYKGNKAIIRDYAAAKGKSVNSLVNELLESEIPGLKTNKKARC